MNDRVVDGWRDSKGPYENSYQIDPIVGLENSYHIHPTLGMAPHRPKVALTQT